MFACFAFCVAALAVAAALPTTPGALGDLVTGLPGLPPNTTFNQYSGFLQADPDNHTHFHYWFVESQNDPEASPLVLWLNGGPGCSSLAGLLEELGPFVATPDGKTLQKNPYSWNTFANVIFLESPACVGFSFNTQNDCSSSDVSTASRNYHALLEFYNKFPQYQKNDLFLTGESYAGVYVPTLGAAIVRSPTRINLKGFAVGNGLLSWRLNSNSVIFYAYFHGLLDEPSWKQLTENCCEQDTPSRENCRFEDSPTRPLSPACSDLVEKAQKVINSPFLDPYNIYSRCPTFRAIQDAVPLHPVSSHLLGRENLLRTSAYQNILETDVPFCKRGWGMVPYLNRMDVQAALHVASVNRTWQICNMSVFENFVVDYNDMKDQFSTLTAAGVRGLVYNGDGDMVCNFLGDQWFVEDLHLPVEEEQRLWVTEEHEVGGLVKRFLGLDLATVRGSGHFVPMDQPAAALQLIKSFIFNKPY